MPTPISAERLALAAMASAQQAGHATTDPALVKLAESLAYLSQSVAHLAGETTAQSGNIDRFAEAVTR